MASGNNGFGATSGPYRPPQYSSGQQSTLMTVTEPNTTSAGNQTGQTTQQTMYYFDAVFLADHDCEGVATEHPVQIGAAITDHFYVRPAHVTLEVGFSDVMDSFVSGQYSGGNASKSVNAYQKLRSIQASGSPVTLTTRLFTYPQMIIRRITAPDDRRTKYAARIRIEFQQIITAQLSITTTGSVIGSQLAPTPGVSGMIPLVPVSARPQDSGSTPLGPVTGQPVPQNYDSTFGVPVNQSSVPGAGTFSSNQSMFESLSTTEI